MSKIIDWEYYSSHFPNVVPEKQFEAVETQAEIEYNKVVKPYMEIHEARQKDTIFQLCNFLWSNQTTLAGHSVASVNNNGYSESYVLQSTAQAQEAMEELIYKGIGTRLAGTF